MHLERTREEKLALVAPVKKKKKKNPNGAFNRRSGESTVIHLAFEL